VPDEIVLGMIRERLADPSTRKGFILDGFPRNLAQAQALDRLLAEQTLPIDAAIHLHVEPEEIVKRITGRRTCGRCGAIYNIYFSPPKQPGICDKCAASDLQQRVDDTEETVRHRLKVYAEQTTPLIEFYDRQGLLKTVAGSGEIGGIFDKIRHALGTRSGIPA
jgi:adenylate kinase